MHALLGLFSATVSSEQWAVSRGRARAWLQGRYGGTESHRRLHVSNPHVCSGQLFFLAVIMTYLGHSIPFQHEGSCPVVALSCDKLHGLDFLDSLFCCLYCTVETDANGVVKTRFLSELGSADHLLRIAFPRPLAPDE